jgi:hypothetical protein
MISLALIGTSRSGQAPLHPTRSAYLAQSLISSKGADEAREVVERGLRLFPDDTRLIGQEPLLQGNG